MGCTPTLGYSARDQEASLRNVSIKDMQWGRGAAPWGQGAAQAKCCECMKL